jgi:hypothetical protein
MSDGPHEWTDWQLEGYHLRELPEADLRRLDARRLEDPQLQARFAALEADNADTLARLPPALVASRVRARAARGRRPLPRRVARLAIVAAATALLLVALLPAPGDAPAFRSKGGPAAQLLVYRRAADGQAVRLTDGDDVGAGDTLQLAYVAPAGSYGVILSQDGRGQVTLQAPDGPDAMPLAPGAITPLAFSYELDDAPGKECFVLVSASRPFRTAGARRAMESTGPGIMLSLPAGASQTSLCLHRR